MPISADLPLDLYQVLEEEYISLHGPIPKDKDYLVEISDAEIEDKFWCVNVRRDWLFHEGHIKNLEVFVKRLTQAGERVRAAEQADEEEARRSGKQPDEVRTARDKLDDACDADPVSLYLWRKIQESSSDVQLLNKLERYAAPKVTVDQASSRVSPCATGDENVASVPPRTGSELEGRLIRELNEILKDESLYTPQRFRHVRLGGHSEGLVKIIDTLKTKPGDKAASAATPSSGELAPSSSTASPSPSSPAASPSSPPAAVSSPPSASPASTPSESASPSSPPENEDMAHLNRLLLEDAYPEAFEGIRNLRLAAIFKRLRLRNQSALSLSGGGIRSGTFALGLLQGLARHNLLEKFDYLSTVSGGGYIGSWLTAWLHRHEDGLAGVTKDLANLDPEGKIDPDPEPLQYLRRYSNFITPKVGLLTADTWTFIGIYFRNLLLNWMVLIPIFAGALLIPRIVVGAILGQSEHPVGRRLALFGWTSPALYYQRYGFLILGTFLIIMAIAYIGFNRPSASEELKERSPFWSKWTTQTGFLIFCWMPLVLGAFLLTTYSAWSRASRVERSWLWLAYLLFGAATTFASWFIYTFVILKRGKLVGKWSEIDWGSLLRRRRLPERWNSVRWWELFALIIVGMLGGFWFWLVAKREFGNPVVDSVDGSWGTWSTEIYACTAAPVFLLLFLLATFFYVGVTSYSRGIRDEEREWLARLSAWVLIAVIIWIALSALVIFGPLALLDSPRILASLGGISGLIALVVGRSSATPATTKDAAKASKTTLIAANLLPLLTLVFLMIFIAALSLLGSFLIKWVFTLFASQDGHWLARLLSQDWLFSADPHVKQAHIEELSRPFGMAGHMRTVHYPSFWFFSILLVVLVWFGYWMARRINLNLFSLHNGYRNRLIRGFLGASRKDIERKPNPFTGFDPLDNIHMHELRPGLLHETDFETRSQATDENIKALLLKLKAAGAPPESADPSKTGEVAATTQEGDAMSRFLSARLKDSRDMVLKYAGDALPDASLKSALLEDLNRILDDEAIRFDREASLDEYRSRGRARRVADTAALEEQDGRPLRREYQILLNRLMLEQAYAGLVKPSPYPPPPYKLFHVINTALNLVGGNNLAWQQRKAEPFSVTALHSGCFRVGYRKSRDYGGPDGISIGTAAAISGAAASSNMGYYTTSPIMSLLLTVFNVRLGWWLGNPGFAGNDTYRRAAPSLSLLPVLLEAFGMTDDQSKYVYLTDGGHFENLALYEMVLRRCQIIVCSDGAEDADYKFGDLGNAVRKIRIDLGVPIEFSKVMIEPSLKEKGLYYAVGKIRYSCVDPFAKDGVLIYIKPVVYALSEPRDVLEYKKNNDAFPHESTADQFFDEPQFESYRMLGSFIMDHIAGEECHQDCEITDLKAFARAAYKNSLASDPDIKDLNFPAWLTSERANGRAPQKGATKRDGLVEAREGVEADAGGIVKEPQSKS